MGLALIQNLKIFIYYVYVIKSINFSEQNYIEYSTNLKKRLEEHNSEDCKNHIIKFWRFILQKERFKLGSFVLLILRRGSEILLIRRFNTGCEDGMYACAGGGLEANETVRHAIIREAAEELGIQLKKDDLKIIHVVHRKREQQEMIGFFIEASESEGQPCIIGTTQM